MLKTKSIAFAAISAIALSACGDSGTTTQSVHIVGSSTVFPFAKKVAEEFDLSNPQFTAPTVESTGSGSGIREFCKGLGEDTPDIANASRRMKASEFETCQGNGVNDIIEIQAGLDGIAFATAIDGVEMSLTPQQVYEALAANPYGGEQTTESWSDVDPSLPDVPILVYGPPSTSGTRDALKELVLEVGCDANPEMEALKDSDEDRHAQVCTEVRADGKFVEQGEQDNLIVQKIGNNPNAIGVFGYSYLEENTDKVRGLAMNGVAPTYENISSFAYPGARPLFMYVKKAHLDVIPGLREYLAQWTQMWSKDGPLAGIGLVASPDDVMEQSRKAATEFTTLDGAALK